MRLPIPVLLALRHFLTPRDSALVPYFITVCGSTFDGQQHCGFGIAGRPAGVTTGDFTSFTDGSDAGPCDNILNGVQCTSQLLDAVVKHEGSRWFLQGMTATFELTYYDVSQTTSGHPELGFLVTAANQEAIAHFFASSSQAGTGSSGDKGEGSSGGEGGQSASTDTSSSLFATASFSASSKAPGSTGNTVAATVLSSTSTTTLSSNGISIKSTSTAGASNDAVSVLAPSLLVSAMLVAVGTTALLAALTL